MTLTEPQLYLDDLYIGQRFPSDSYHLDASAIKKFAEEYDPQPFHLDESAAANSFFKELVASGWHTAAIAMKLLATGGLPIAHGIIGYGAEVAWPQPARPGDVLHLQSEIAAITPSRSKPGQAVVTVKSTMLNQKNEAVYQLNAKLLVYARRPTA